MSEVTFQQVQQQFCQAIRDAESSQMPTVEADHLHLYRELLLNNMRSFVETVYPVAKSLLPEATWQQLVHDFFAQSACSSPFYHDISLHFREYVEHTQLPLIESYPWLLELLQYEWLELYLDTLVLEESTVAQDSNAAHADWRLKCSVWVLVYQYPVYAWQVGQALEQLAPQPSAIMVWRDAEDQIRVEPLNAIFAILIEQLSQAAMSSQHLQQVLQQHLPEWSSAQQQQQLQQLRIYLQQHALL